MSKEIHVERLGDDHYRVTVDERASATNHDVRATPDDVQRYGRPEESAEELIRRSFEFLLEREPKESILPKFDLPVIGRYFSDYETTIRK